MQKSTLNKITENVNSIASNLLDKINKDGEPVNFSIHDLQLKLSKPFQQVIELGFMDSKDLTEIVEPFLIKFQEADRIKIAKGYILYTDLMKKYKTFCEVTLLEALYHRNANKDGKVEITFSIDQNLLEDQDIEMDHDDKVVFKNKDGHRIQPSINYTNKTEREETRRLLDKDQS